MHKTLKPDEFEVVSAPNIPGRQMLAHSGFDAERCVVQAEEDGCLRVTQEDRKHITFTFGPGHWCYLKKGGTSKLLWETAQDMAARHPQGPFNFILGRKPEPSGEWAVTLAVGHELIKVVFLNEVAASEACRRFGATS
jgi:hypothetical protein